MSKPIYLDYNATTPIDPRVVKAMIPYLEENFGNPSSSHYYGKINKEAVNKARKQLSELLGCDENEVIFTSGGSESNNFAIKGVAFANQAKGNHMITSAIEHPAITNPCRYLEKFGFKTTYLPVDEYGLVNPADVKKAITKETILITVMHANNEVGTIEPISEIGEIAKESGIYFHTDSAQSVGKIPVLVKELNVDLLTVAAHKFYGPKGIGALFIKEGVKIDPFIHGAGHEFGKRAGTENVAGIVALGEAANIAKNEMANYSSDVLALREKLYRGILEIANKVKLNGHPSRRLPNTLNISFLGLDGADLLAKLDGVAASTGSACHDGISRVSDVLVAMGVDSYAGFGSVRFSLGKFNTEEEIDLTLEILRKALKA